MVKTATFRYQSRPKADHMTEVHTCLTCSMTSPLHTLAESPVSPSVFRFTPIWVIALNFILCPVPGAESEIWHCLASYSYWFPISDLSRSLCKTSVSLFACLLLNMVFSLISMDLHSSGWMRKAKILTLVIALPHVMSCFQVSVAEDKWHFWRISCGWEGVGVLVVSCCLLSHCHIQSPGWSRTAG